MLGIGQHLAESIPNARLEVMSGVAHLPPMEAPEEFVALVTAFLEAS
jgi:pimeloyl-ACP methyl ester carboxylesterase